MPKLPPYTQFTLKHLRGLGYEPWVVEKRLPRPKDGPGWGKTVDLYGCIDVVCLHPEFQGVIGVQSTSEAAISSHVRKIREEPRALLWMECGNALLLFGWERTTPARKDGRPGKAMRWRPRVFRFTPESYAGRGRPEEIEFGARR